MIFVVSVLVGGIIGFLVISFLGGFISAMKGSSPPRKPNGAQKIKGTPQHSKAKPQGTPRNTAAKPQGVRAKPQGTPKKQTTRRTQGVSPSPVDIWWGNLQRTPLSDSEAQRIAAQVAQFYNAWQADYTMNHSWLCIALNADKVECRQLYRSFDRGAAPTPTFSYSHRLSCQADREHLAQHILRRIRQDAPGCALYLDGDSLILPTNG